MSTRTVLFSLLAVAVFGAATVALPEAEARDRDVTGVRERVQERVARIEVRVDERREQMEQRKERVQERVKRLRDRGEENEDCTDDVVPTPDPEEDIEGGDEPEDEGPDDVDDTGEDDVDDDGDGDTESDGDDSDDTGDTEDSDDGDVEEPVDEGVAPTVTLTALPGTVTEGETTALGWTSEDAAQCVASGAADWSGAVATSGARTVVVLATTTYELACGNAYGTTTELVEVYATAAAEPAPEPTTGAVLITEVLFNPGPTEAQGTDSDNEWIEIYNGTDVAVDLGGWSIGDGSATDIISSESLLLPAGEHLIVTRSASTDTFWVYGPGTVVVHLDATLGSAGLSNAGESAILYDAESAVVDSVSWGTDTSTMSPSVDLTGIAEGESIARSDVASDTDTAADWVIAAPTPGV